MAGWHHQLNGHELNKFLELVMDKETWVQTLGWEDPLEEGMATHTAILTRRIPMDRGV